MNFLIEKQDQAKKTLLFSLGVALLAGLLLTSDLYSGSDGDDLIWRKIASAVINASPVSR